VDLKKHKLKWGIGILIGVVFIFLALWKVDFSQMAQAFRTANYWYLIPTVPILFFSHWLRALRWRYLLDPVKRLDLSSLFSALIIGYMANVLTPAHLGEFLRAYVLGKKRGIAGSTAFATIVMERIIDVFTGLTLTVVALLMHPFPPWVRNGAYGMLAGTLGFFLFLVFLKRSGFRSRFVFLLRWVPGRFRPRITAILKGFVSGIVPLKQRRDYVTVTGLSLLIWGCYAVPFFLSLKAFDLTTTYQVPWSASLVLLVFTTISVAVPSSPGYVGTYHYLGQISLAPFGVPAGPALLVATVVHGINFFPVLVAGLVLSYFEGVRISKLSDKKAFFDGDITQTI
jgi:uncharacterized protein (TIRG00374 family)